MSAEMIAPAIPTALGQGTAMAWIGLQFSGGVVP
jgi:hypothetical protein